MISTPRDPLTQPEIPTMTPQQLQDATRQLQHLHQLIQAEINQLPQPRNPEPQTLNAIARLSRQTDALRTQLHQLMIQLYPPAHGQAPPPNTQPQHTTHTPKDPTT